MNKDPLLYRDHASVFVWLLVCMVLVAGMVTLGGYTRLSGSGLSITEWKPVHGTLPPMNDAEWEEEFDAYKETPQYQKVNSDMELEDFKGIYWPEYFHRLLGRIIGLTVLIPFIIFLARGSVSQPIIVHMGGVFLLGALQGFIGWVMVQSGLVDNPSVSHVRLALHLAMAFAIFGLLEWLWLSLLAEQDWWKKKPREVISPPKIDMFGMYVLWFFFFCLQILFGAFMAGLHAGFVYNTWPTMNGEWVPNLSGDIELIQFIHRWLAALVVAGFFGWWIGFWRYINNIHLINACLIFVLLLCAQFGLGVWTLVGVVPLHPALTHQFMALVLFAGGLYLLHKLAAEQEAEE